MSYVIQIEWLGGSEGPSEPTESDGRYVSRFDPDAHDGRGHVWTVADPQDAMQFADQKEALVYYRQASMVKPTREDGRPNRPLTAFSVSVFDPER
jgi:hypothetical protein